MIMKKILITVAVAMVISLSLGSCKGSADRTNDNNESLVESESGINIDSLLHDMEELVVLSEEVKNSEDVTKAMDLMNLAAAFQEKYENVDEDSLALQMTSRQLERYQELTGRMDSIQ